MVDESADDLATARAKLVAEGIKEVAAELRLINVADFISFIHREQFGNIEDIINSSTELYFKHGTLCYGCAADYDIDWDRPPSISIELDFRHREVSVSFCLLLCAFHASVTIRSINFVEPGANADEDTQQLAAAMTDAKLAEPACR